MTSGLHQACCPQTATGLLHRVTEFRIFSYGIVAGVSDGMALYGDFTLGDFFWLFPELDHMRASVIVVTPRAAPAPIKVAPIGTVVYRQAEGSAGSGVALRGVHW